MRITDFMPMDGPRNDIVRIVEGLRGQVGMEMELVIRFDYGLDVPWVRQRDGATLATAGPDSISLRTPVQTRGEHMRTVARFKVGAGERVPFVLSHRASHETAPRPFSAEHALRKARRDWRAWSRRGRYEGRWPAEVMRSLITLKALIHEPTGGIVAAPTTSLPEQRGGLRNWDYRYCRLRDATFTLNTLLLAGYDAEAVAWREWLLRDVADSAKDLQILYGVTGERRLPEYELPWLAGDEGAKPVRVGNAASEQFQLDVYGEVMDMLHQARAAGLELEPHVWQIQCALLAFVAENWDKPDDGLWEIRGPRRHFTHSKVMAWVAFDRAVKDAERFGLAGPVQRWRMLRDAIHAQVSERGLDTQRGCFVQHYDTADLDASQLSIPAVATPRPRPSWSA